MKNRWQFIIAACVVVLTCGLLYSADTTSDKPLEDDNAQSDYYISECYKSKSEMVTKLQNLLDEHYSHRDVCGVDWKNLFRIYGPQLEKANSERMFAKTLAEMLGHTKDIHIRLYQDDKRLTTFMRKMDPNCNVKSLARKIPDWQQLSDKVCIGRFSNGIGYILIQSWQKDEQTVLRPALDGLKKLGDCRALIIDIRPNSGGSETYAGIFAGCFVSEQTPYARHIYRDLKKYSSGWSSESVRTIRPNKDEPRYKGSLAVLMGNYNMSSCEAFILMMKNVPNCTVIGEKSYGSSGNSKEFELGKSIKLWLPSWKAMTLDRKPIEHKGIEPDITIHASQKQLRDNDPLIRTAMRVLNKR